MIRRPRIFLGLTITQLGILGGLALLAMLSIGGMFWMVYSASQVSIPTALPSLTPLPPATETPLPPTNTPLPPTATATPTPAVPDPAPDGWVKFESAQVELWLPPEYIGGDMLDNRDATIKQISALQTKTVKLNITSLKKAPPEVIMLIYHKPLTPGLLTAVYVTKFTRTPETELQAFVDEMMNKLPGAVSIFGTHKITVLGREAQKIEIEQRIEGSTINATFIYIKNGADFWVIDYDYQPAEIVEMTQMVKNSIKTLNFK